MEIEAAAADSYRRIVKALSRAIGERDLDRFQRALLEWFDFKERLAFPNPVLRVCADPFEPDSFAPLPPPIKLYALDIIFRDRIRHLRDLTPQIEFLTQPGALANVPSRFRPPFTYLLLVGLLLQGRGRQAEAFYGRQRQKLSGFGLPGWFHFLAAEDQAAIRAFKADLALLRRREQNPSAYFTGFEGLIFLLALLADHSHRHLPLLKEILAGLEQQQAHNPLLPAYRIFNGIIARLENCPVAARQILSMPPPADDAVALLFAGLAHNWLGGSVPQRLLAPLRDLARRARRNSLPWLSPAAHGLIPRPAEPPTTSLRSLASIIQPREPWQHALLALDHHRESPGPAEAEPDRRLAWHFSYQATERRCRLKPVIQRRRPEGTWSKGRPLALRRLIGGGELTDGGRPVLLDRRDQALRAAIRREKGPGGESCWLDPDLSQLVGHPHLFLAGQPEMRVKLEPGRPSLLIEKGAAETVLVRLSPFPDRRRQLLIRQGPGDFQAICCDRQLHQLAARLGPDGLRWPAAAGAALFAHLGELPGNLSIYSQWEQIAPAAVPEAADGRIIMQLLPSGSGLRLRLRVRPLGPEGPCLPPGSGTAWIWAEINGCRRQVQRDLATERAAAAELGARCGLRPEKRLADENGEAAESWLLAEPWECLEFLARLREHSPATPLEWPEGEGFSLSPTAGLNRLHLKIGRKNNWFGLEGSLRLDNGLVLELGKLLQAATECRGRFIPLGHGRFLSLSAELKRKLEEIEAYAEIRRGEVRLHPLAARLLLDGSRATAPQLETDQPWRDFLARLARTEAQPPPLPTGLRAELRHYQLEGYHWLQRLAELGFGACLADDMGLGKTIQALALLLSRAPQGAGLVIAPTSVCRNWQEEAARFAPDLKVIPYEGPGRRKLLRQLGPFDLVVCSYSLLQRDAEAIADHRWQTIVLDEAQAIKNFLAKRSRAAMKLDGAFKLITTGTPLENHLAELWTLFRFINPGLLGTLDHFTRRFIIPIEQHQDGAARRRLKKLLTPFVLRRLKREVLSELPPRTDVILRVEMSREEAAMYEALRRRALANLGAGHPRKDSPLKILAEIMKLRRVCCHPRLVLPESELPCAKHDLFVKVVAELLENRHRILVFSQFVGHLAIIRELLDQRRISYQYLDGATPAAVRQQRVQAFQQGRGDLFLISLRAGGLGLNLTAADYVIHLDPWWNPAVEEQASDRAHRIGQKKPVTVYRLISAGTIEEKILALHHRKRELSSDLLDGNREGPPRSSAELLALLQNP